MKKIAMAAVAEMLSAIGSHGLVRSGIQRTPSDTKLGRRMVSKGYRSRSKYMPHQGAKERERARRCYMVGGILRQMSKRQYEAHFREVD